MYPVWLKPLRNASRFLTVTCAELDPRNPITGIAGCCASAAPGQAAAPPSSNMNLRRFTAQCLPCFPPKDSTPRCTRRLLRCGISIRLMSPSGHSRRLGVGRESACLAISDMDVPLADACRPCSRNGTLWNLGRRIGSLWLDVGRPDHLGPLLSFFGDQLAEIGGRARKHRTAFFSETAP